MRRRRRLQMLRRCEDPPPPAPAGYSAAHSSRSLLIHPHLLAGLPP